MKAILLGAVAAVLLTSCGGGPAPTATGGEPGACATGGGTAIIDWVDFFQVDGITYSSDRAYGYKVTKADLGPVFTRTRCRLSDVVTDPEYRTRDGDAGFLEPGTEVYELKGYDPSFRLVAKSSGKWTIYESDTSPKATHGLDLLDLEDKVAYIGVNSVKDGRTEIGAIRDPQEVTRLVEMVLAAPVDQDRNPADDEYDEQVFVAFHFEDGSVTSRAFYPDSRLLWRGIVVPQAFADAIEDAKQSS